MPELPEVETVIRDLSTVITGKTIQKINVLSPKIINQDLTNFISNVKNKAILNLNRFGKYIFIKLSNQKNLIVHLRMTGQFFYSKTHFSPDKHTHVIFTFQDNSELIYRDIRQFGRLAIYNETLETFIKNKQLGPDALVINKAELYSKLQSRKSAIKKVLLNQAVLAGLGNIYADEILWQAGIHPNFPANLLNTEKTAELTAIIKRVLNMAIAAKGTSVSDYRTGENKKGSYQDELKVYGRKDKPCERCKNLIVKIKLAGRGTHFCPQCQNYTE